jgi:hypothetical protein
MRTRREEQRLQRWKQENDAARDADVARRSAEGGRAAPQVAWPPPTAHAPMLECLVCASDDLVETRDSAIMMTVKDTPDASYVDYPTLVNIVVCRHCGHLEFFANNVKAFVSAYQSMPQTPRALPPIGHNPPVEPMPSAGRSAQPPPTEVGIPAVPAGGGIRASTQWSRPSADELPETEAVPVTKSTGRRGRRIEKIDRDK